MNEFDRLYALADRQRKWAENEGIQYVKDIRREIDKMDAETIPTVYPPVEKLLAMDRIKLDELFDLINTLLQARNELKQAKSFLAVASGNLQEFWTRETGK